MVFKKRKKIDKKKKKNDKIRDVKNVKTRTNYPPIPFHLVHFIPSFIKTIQLKRKVNEAFMQRKQGIKIKKRASKITN